MVITQQDNMYSLMHINKDREEGTYERGKPEIL
jgi:hypothetical protein